MKKIVLALIILVVIIVTIFSFSIEKEKSEKKSIIIAVAANVSYAIESLKASFNKIYPNIEVRVILGSSGKLTAQIKNNAPYEIFMSANMFYPNTLYSEKIAKTEPIIYAQGALVLVTIKDFNLTKGLNILKEVKKIAIANPKTAPYGKASIEALKKAYIYNDIEDKLVYAESISQTLSYVKTATDMGFIAKSSLFNPQMREYKENKNWIDIDKSLYTPINQGIVIIKPSKEVKAFYDFILSPKAKAIFKDFGYLVKN